MNKILRIFLRIFQQHRLTSSTTPTHILYNTDSPTRKPFNTNTNTNQTSPVISFSYPDLALRSSWRATHDLSSDHLPIILTHSFHSPLDKAPKRTCTNYKRADWENFTHHIDNTLANFNINNYANIDAAMKYFNTIVIHNSKQYMPTEAITQFSPGFNRNIKHKIRTRHYLRHQRPKPDIINDIQTLNKEIQDDIRHEQQTTWKHLLSTISYKTNPSKLWRLIRTLNNTYTDAPDTHEAITTNRNTIPNPKQQSNLLNQHYSSISRLPHYTEDKKIERRQRKLRPQNDPPPPFTPNMTKQAIEETKPTFSVGPDGISYRHLKHLGL